MLTSNNSTGQEQMSYKHQHTLEVLESYIQYQNETLAHYESKAQQYATVSSILGALVAAFVFNKPDIHMLEGGVLIIFMFSTFLSLATMLWVIRFQDWKKTIDMEKLDIMISRQDEIPLRLHYDEWILTYTDVIKSNERILDEKGQWIPSIRYCIVYQIACTFFLMIFHFFL